MERVAAALSAALVGAQLQRARYDGAGGLSLKLRGAGRTFTLFLSSRKGSVGAGLVERAPQSPANPHALTSYLRAHLEGGRLTAVRCLPLLLELSFTVAGQAFFVYLETRRDWPRLFVADGAGVVKVSERWDAAGGPVRPGQPFVTGALSQAPETFTPEKAVEFLEREGARLLDLPSQESGEGKVVRRWRSRLVRRIENIERDLSSLPQVEGLTSEAEEVAANLWLDPKGGGRIDALYRAAKRVRRAKMIAAERLSGARLELEQGPPMEKPGAGRQAAAKGGSTPYRRYKSSDGWRILVGRNRLENDRLVRDARPWDLWLHALGGSGAHVVVVKPGREADPPERTLLEAAALAAHFSSLAAQKAVDVTIAEASRVSKPKGAGSGRVVVAGGRTIRVAPDQGAAKLIS